jgi:hypothetical protein
VIAVVVLLVVIFARREMQATRSEPAATMTPVAPSDAPPDAPVDLTKGDPAAAPTWVRDARTWFDEAREASRRRRRRSLPIRIAMLATLAVTLTVLGIIDAVSGIQLQAYFWATLGIVVAGLVAGLVSRRTPVSMTTLLFPAIAGVIAFGGSHASLHDGIGQREWQPTSAPASQYNLAFGQGILDLTKLPANTQATIHVTMAAGQVNIIAPATLNLTVQANIHIGQLQVDGADFGGHHNHGGVGLSRTVDPPAGATGAPVTVIVHLADGNITVNHS